MLKRMGLFLLTNLAVIVLISIILSLLNIQPYLTQQGLDLQSLLAYAAVIGFTGAMVSLFLSKWMAKQAYGIQMLTKPKTAMEEWLLSTVETLARQMHIGMPEVGIYDSSEANAFATGWNKNEALVAVSSGLLETMDKAEIEAVLGHEVSHVANGDMVTMTLLQGVINTFVIFFARVAAYLVTQALRSRSAEAEDTGSPFVFYGVAMLFEIIFGLLASLIVMWFSRYREFRADAGSAQYVGKEKMIKALQRLEQISKKQIADQRAPALDAFKISNNNKIFKLFSSHPPIEERIAALRNIGNGVVRR